MTADAKIGVLALQGDFREHRAVLENLGVSVVEVRLPEDLAGLHGLIIPGGESTTIGGLLERYGLSGAIIRRHKEGMAIWGTCAGAILLAKRIEGSQQKRLGLMDITVRRNAYGRQLDSFETELEVTGLGGLHGVFIRAPMITRTGKGVEILASFEGQPVMVRQGNLLATTFHPEVSGSAKAHEYFLEKCVKRKDI